MRSLNLSDTGSILLGMALSLVLSVGAAAQTASPSTDSQSANPPAAQTAPEQSPSSQQPSTSSGAQAGATSSDAHAGAQQGSAQQGGSNSIDDELQLTDDQKQKIAAIVDDENKQLSGIRNDNSMTLDQKKQKALEVRQTATPKIKAILTPEQLQKLATIQQRMREQQGQGSSTPPSQNTTPNTPQNQSTPQNERN